MKTTFKQYLLEAKVKMPKAESKEDLIASIVDQYFTKDGSHLKVDTFKVIGLDLKSLVGMPKNINGSFDCFNSKLTSLEGGPEKINGSYDCSKNPSMTSLKGSPKEILGFFNCYKDDLRSLEGGPIKVGDDFYCSENKLESLKGAPIEVGGGFVCSTNALTSLEGAPKKVGRDLKCQDNHLTSLESIHMHIHEIGEWADFRKNPIKSHVLGLLKIKGLEKVVLDNKEVQKIINKYLLNATGKDPSLRDIVDCQEELMDNDLEDYALL